MKEGRSFKNILSLFQWGVIFVLGGSLVATVNMMSGANDQAKRLLERVDRIERTLQSSANRVEVTYTRTSRPPTQRPSQTPRATFTAVSTATLRSTNTQVPAPTDTLQPTNTQVPEATETLAPTATALTSSPNLVPKTSMNVRSGPGTNYPTIGLLPAQTPVPVIGTNSAQTWFIIEYQNGMGWVYGGSGRENVEGDVSKLAVVDPPPPPNPQPANPTAAPAGNTGLPGPCPRNCTACVAAGWTAEQCGQCPNLDRDKDGVACYGN